MRLAIYLVLAMLCASVALAQTPEDLEALGFGPTVAMWIAVALLCLRGVAATISANVPDAKLGKVAKPLNALGGNTGFAKNAGAWIIGALFAGALLTVPAPAMAADCNFEKGVDLKVVRFAWPPSISLPLRVVDTEAGFGGPTLVCGNVSVELRAAVCEIPKVGGWLGPLCPTAPPEAE